jgi:hypothetical protein
MTPAYVWMIASALLHAAVPLMLKFVSNPMTLLAAVIIGSLILNIIVHGILQYQSCPESFSVARLFKGAAVGTAIAAGAAAVPVYLEGPRRIVSELFFKHQPLMGVSGEQPTCQIACPKPEPLTEEAYGQQVLAEMRIALAYWTAFAGAYGVSVGGLFSMNCGT